MTDGPPPETETAIMDAVREALVEYGYADLSMAKIAEGYDGSQSLLHYHYDTKEGLLAAYLAHERERTAERLAGLPEDPAARFEAVVETLLGGFGGEEATATAYMELYALAARSDPVAAELRETLALVRGTAREAVADAVAAGVLDDCDPGATATMLVAGNSAVSIEGLLGVDWDARAAVESVVLGREGTSPDPGDGTTTDPGEADPADPGEEGGR